MAEVGIDSQIVSRLGEYLTGKKSETEGGLGYEHRTIKRSQKRATNYMGIRRPS